MNDHDEDEQLKRWKINTNIMKKNQNGSYELFCLKVNGS